MKDAQPQAIYLSEYCVPSFLIHQTVLEFDLADHFTLVKSTLTMQRNPACTEAQPALILHGAELELIELHIDGVVLAEQNYHIDGELLTIARVPNEFTLGCITKIYPQNNTSLEGLYRSRAMYCTQCEAEGFRKITYYLDRPDVMSEFITTITAEKKRFPTLLSNGNLSDQGELDDGRHWATWHDPFKKPAYLFALVAGDLDIIEDSFTTCSGREVALRIFVENKDTDKCGYAMAALKRAMKWDEEVYGREYDLDIFMVVAVDDFNMGAMENKGLNIFNTSCVLASPATTTDSGFQRVEAVVAHEYFHNWSGNRVTCRDWFQLSLKEGFTVFRDAQFSADMGSPTVKRVEDVTLLRTSQFAEDAGPMAHPVQPDSFIEISNFYTLTIYEKGAEIVRMLHTLLGAETFRQGSDLYFDKHDGEAVTIQEFVAAMSAVSDRDLAQFMRWYKHAGTPTVKAKGHYNPDKKTYSLTLEQVPPSTSVDTQGKPAPFHLPVVLGLLGKAGPLPLRSDGNSCTDTSRIIELTEMKHEIVFEQVDEAPVPSLFRNFSAPIILDYHYTREQLVRIVDVDEDGFCRWDASQRLAVAVIKETMTALVSNPAPAIDDSYIALCDRLLADTSLDPAMVALMLTLPSENYLAEQGDDVVEIELIHHARNRVKRRLAVVLYDRWLSVYERLRDTGEFAADAGSIGKRSLRNLALDYLVCSAKQAEFERAQRQFVKATNMTDELAALSCICHGSHSGLVEIKRECLALFYEKWKEQALVINHWLSVQACDPGPNTLQKVKELMSHPGYDGQNPNKLRSLIGSFTMRNPIHFHERKGSGYEFLAEQILVLNKQNPQVAARLLSPLTKWKKYDEDRQQKMKAQLQRIAAEPNLSTDVYEVVTKSLQF